MSRLLIFFSGILLFAQCNNPVKNGSRVVVKVEMSNAYNQWIYLEKLPLYEETPRAPDSVFVKDRVETIRFLIDDTEERLYRLYSKDHRVDIVLINDITEVFLQADYFDNGLFQFVQSPANISLHQFLASVRQIAETARQVQKSNPSDTIINKLLYEQQLAYRSFVDTVSSPAAALYVYNAVDFGNDRIGLKKFVDKLSKRFPDHKGIGLLVQDTRDFLSIYEKELNAGDKLPSLLLPDKSGVLQGIGSPSNYRLVSFWASWDRPSRIQAEYDKKAFEEFGKKGLTVISISLDPEREAWKKYIESAGYQWTHLIDERGWRGAAVKNCVFDSIPFNFIVDKSDRIIAKAMYGDSLLLKLRELIR